MIPEEPPRSQFEHRMRLRRAATCVSAARAALEAGRVVEAEERLEEACRLDPEGIEARLLLEQLQIVAPEGLGERTPALDALEPRGARRWSHWVALFIAVGALAALAWLRQPGDDDATTVRPRSSPERSVAKPEAPAAVEAAPPPAFPGMEPPGTGTLDTPVSTSGRDELESTVPRPAPTAGLGTSSAERAAVRKAEPVSQPAEAEAGPTRAELGAQPPPASVETPASAGTAPGQPAPPKLQVGLPPVLAAAPPDTEPLKEKLVDPPLKVAPEPAAAPDAARASLPDPAAEEEAVGETLRRYSDAYSNLDASAARQVWPTVDERALARAFAGLESQALTFDRCELKIDGAEAAAVCSGRARYVPKVGSGDPINQSRRWTFRLRRAQDGWQIVRAEAR